MLAARVEASADLHANVVAACKVGQPVFELLIQYSGKTARRRDTELAAIRSGTRRDVCHRRSARLRELKRFKVAMKRRKVGARHPTDQKILVHGGSNGVLYVFAANLRQLPQLR